MNKEEYMQKLEHEFIEPGYSWLHDAHKQMLRDANLAMIDIFTDAKAFERFSAMCKSVKFDGFPKSVLSLDDLENLYDCASTIIDYDILDDGDLQIVYDKRCDRWFLDRTYEFVDDADRMCRFYDIAREDMEIAHISDWNRNVWKDDLENTHTTLGLIDFIEILKHIKLGDLSSIHDSLGLSSLQSMMDNRAIQ